MATVDPRLFSKRQLPLVPKPTETEPRSRPLHRVAEARKRQGVSLRSAANRSELDIHQLREQERPDNDLRLSDLYRWQKILDIPITELLEEPEACALSPPILKRAQLLKLMKTAKAIVESTGEAGIKRMAERMVTQLIEIMPELADIGAWHTIGQRRTLDEYGRAAQAIVPERYFPRS